MRIIRRPSIPIKLIKPADHGIMSSLSDGDMSRPSRKGSMYPTEKVSAAIKCIIGPRKSSEIRMERSIGFLGCLSFIMGTIIGSGIFISPGGILQNTNNIWAAMIVWAMAGMISLAGGLVLIELSTVIPVSGGEYTYILAAFGGIPAFLTVWSYLMLIRPSSMGVLVLTTAVNIIEPIAKEIGVDPGDISIKLATKLLTIFLLCVIAFMNCVSVRLATYFQVICTAGKLGGLVVIIISGIYNLSTGHDKNLRVGFENATTNVGKLANALYVGLWAYDGWDQLNLVTEEIVNPYRNLPWAICVGMPFITIIYMLTNIAFLTRVDIPEFSHASVALLYGDRSLGVMSFLMPLAVILSCLGAANGTLFSAARMTLVAARNGHLPDVVSFVDVNQGTPTPAIIIMVSITTAMVLMLDIEGLIDFLSYIVWIAYGGTAITHIVFRCRRPAAPRPFKTPIAVSLILVLAAIFLTIATVVLDPRLEYLYAVAFTTSGLLLYFPFVYFELRIPGMESATKFLQLTLRVTPPAIDKSLLEDIDAAGTTWSTPSASRSRLTTAAANSEITRFEDNEDPSLLKITLTHQEDK
ncbi:unnamed protein product [Allacma fusca]|uniref:Amino acid transporter n=1 Tax=Allacma fusca TaxID=39272 RepID=A0A8J2LAE2_9HEXA|nr:unnamed protein product [Allacma fusca]